MREYYQRNKEKFKEYRKTRRAYAAAYQQLYQETIPHEVKKARWRLAYAVKKGRIIRPETCQRCGSKGTIEGHHHKGYAPEHTLDVEWLCKPCHGAEQRGRDYRPRIEPIAVRRIYQPGERPFDLTVRQSEIARLYVQGLSMKEVAMALGISWRTVNFQLELTYRRLMISSRQEMIDLWRQYVVDSTPPPIPFKVDESLGEMLESSKRVR